MRVHN